MFKKIYGLYRDHYFELAKQKAKHFYYTEFWDEKYNMIPSKLAHKIFDLSVNRGKITAIKSLQRVLKYKLLYNITVTGVFDSLDVRIITMHAPVDEIYNEYIKANHRSYRRMNMAVLYLKGWLKRLFTKY